MDTSIIAQKFRPHPHGNYAMFGLNNLGTNSIITVVGDHEAVSSRKNHIWRFHSYIAGCPDYLANYINECGEISTFNFNNPDVYNNIIRLEEID